MTQTAGETREEQELTDQASAKVQEGAAAVQQKASELRGEGTARFRDEFDQRSTEIGKQARSMAEALRHSGSELRAGGNPRAAQLTDPVADRVESLGGYLERTSGDEVLRDIDSFARDRPWLLAGIGMMVGIAAARFVKASSERRYPDNRPAPQRLQPQQPQQRQPAGNVAGSRRLSPTSQAAVAGSTSSGPR